MTFNELAAVFESDDLNPNAKLIFEPPSGGEYVIDDVCTQDNYVYIDLRRHHDS